MVNPRLGERLTASAEAGGRHVRLTVEYTQTGWVAEVVEIDGNTQVAHEPAHSLESAKQIAEEIAKAYLANRDLRLPAVEWRVTD